MMTGIAQITGVWQGRSISRQKEHTEWNDTVITAQHDDRSPFDALIVEGHGISHWKRKTIPFVLKGAFDPSTKQFRFTKQHYGQYTNSVNYKGILLITPAIIRFEGVYDSGDIELLKVSSITAGIPMLLSGTYSGVCRHESTSEEWNDVELTCENHGIHSFPGDTRILTRLLDVRGAGTTTSEQTRFSISGSADAITLRVTIEQIMDDTPSGTYDCVINTSSMEIATMLHDQEIPNTNTNTANTNELRLVQMNRDTLLQTVPRLWTNAFAFYQQQLSSSESNSNAGSEGRIPRHLTPKREDADALCSYLDGLWIGISTDVQGKVTHWRPLPITATHENDDMHVMVTGHGESVWKDMTVEFSLRGTLDILSLQFEMIKQFTGAYENSVRYIGTLCLALKTSEDDTSSNESNSGKYIIPSDIAQIIDFMEQGTAVLCLRGEFDRGRLLLWREDNPQYEQPVISREPTPQAVSPAPDAHELNDSTTADSQATTTRTASDDARITRYRLMLCSVLLSGRVTARDMKILRNFKEAEGINEEEHQKVLHDLGWTTDMLDLSSNASAALADASDGAEKGPDDSCKICYANSIDSVFIPCGHFVVCKKCARKVRECPVCRRGITNVQPVYR